MGPPTFKSQLELKLHVESFVQVDHVDIDCHPPLPNRGHCSYLINFEPLSGLIGDVPCGDAAYIYIGIGI